jgi:hypothetical protein
MMAARRTSHLLSRILLAMLMLPLAALLYLIVVVVGFRYSNSWGDTWVWLFAGLGTWLAMAGYWFLLWRRAVRWTSQRIALTLGAGLAAASAAIIVSLAVQGMMRGNNGDFAIFVGTAIAPLLWLVATAFIWRENRTERAERLRSGRNRQALVCPNCGYNLTGLTTARCPECGAQYTVDELIALQPSAAPAAVVGNTAETEV